MKILLHSGVGNTDRPSRWSFVTGIFSDLARTLTSLGHECLVWHHQHAGSQKVFFNNSTVDIQDLLFEPDYVITWNGGSDGDKQVISKFSQEKMIYVELGFFDHYNSLYFDINGVNGKSQNLLDKLEPFDVTIYDSLVSRLKKERKLDFDYIFVPMQDETDTQIVQYSPFSRMQELLDYVCTLYSKSNIKIVYKKHPKAPCAIIQNKNCIEVFDNVHHYLPYAKEVIGINSTVLLEALLYHNRVKTLGIGITSRNLCKEEHKQYITHLASKQMYWCDVNNKEVVQQQSFYKQIIGEK